ncbi:hypothetical protein [Sphingobium olei]|uniref:Uncharacterized protein n=1 Tax=Sphingobium olei TaxID=420955 RepID=A0ABW3NWS0_9SPHN
MSEELPLAVAIVLERSVITFGGVEQTKLPEQSANMIRALSAEVEALRAFYQAVHDMTCVWADTDRPSSICPHRRDEAEDDDEEDLWDNFVATRARVKALLNKEPAR